MQYVRPIQWCWYSSYADSDQEWINEFHVHCSANSNLAAQEVRHPTDCDQVVQSIVGKKESRGSTESPAEIVIERNGNEMCMVNS